MPEEEWLHILGPFYHNVSNLGRIRHEQRQNEGGKKIVPVLKQGHAVVYLASWHSSTRVPYRLDKLVFETFHDVIVPSDQALVHLDGDPMNCSLDNLVLEGR
jgi:hypothetical protein